MFASCETPSNGPRLSLAETKSIPSIFHPPSPLLTAGPATVEAQLGRLTADWAAEQEPQGLLMVSLPIFINASSTWSSRPC